MVRKVVVTGMGIMSNIGLNLKDVVESLKNKTSGIKHDASFEEMGMRSHISGSISGVDPSMHINRKHLRFMADAAIFAYLSLQQAIEDANLSESDVSNPLTGLIAGSGGPSSSNLAEAVDVARSKGPKRIGPYMVTKCMNSSVSACLASPFKIKGVNMSISSACATSAHCIAIGMDQIRYGQQDIVFAGGAEECHWTTAALFDAMGALSSSFNDRPEEASRPWNSDRDGFVMGGGGGFLVLEEEEHAKKRNAKIYAELKNYGANSDGDPDSIVTPTGEGAVRCIQSALGNEPANTIDYINAHATSTPAGDEVELASIDTVFGEHRPYISATKALNGHGLGVAGVHEAIFTLLMMTNNFVGGTLNAEKVDIPYLNLVKETIHKVKLNRVLSNNFGFGGTNACLLFDRYSL